MNKFSVAPMIDWTDRHCRYFHRQLSKNATLYTEMIVDQAVLHGDAAHLLDESADKKNVVLQLGGSDSQSMNKASQIAADMGYQEINLNCGCPSDRVQAGVFGAVLMLEPKRVADILSAMSAASGVKISLKIRLGVDEQDVQETLPTFLETIAQAPVQDITIHARKAWLQGLSPKDNRTIPPLDYDLALAMKAQFPDFRIALNGGLEDLTTAKAQLERGFDGVMLGRAAYHKPYEILAPLDSDWYGGAVAPTREEIVEIMSAYLAAHFAQGGRVHQVTRHMIGLFHGQKGGRRWRQYLTEEAKHNDPNILRNALHEISVNA